MTGLMELVFKQDFATMGPGADASVKPVARQYDIKPGDRCLALTSDSVVDKEVSLMTILNPEEHALTFPDWEDRVMKSYVLCDWIGQSDMVSTIGWFARSRLMPLTVEQYDELLEGFRKKDLEDFPDWLVEGFRQITDELALNQPDMVHRRATCGPCGSRNVDVHWSVEIEGSSRAMVVQNDGVDQYVAQDEEAIHATWQAHLHCQDCKAQGTLGEEEFKKPRWMNSL